MTTVAEIINLSLRDLGIVGEGQTASGDTLDEAFTTLNMMLGLWQADGLYVFAQKVIVATLTGASSYTIGSGGAINVPRPIKVDSATWHSDSVVRDVESIRSLTDYERLPVAGASEIPCAVCYVASYPLGTLYVYPSGATGELHLVTRTDMPQYIDQTDDIAVPPEYAMALRYSLAEHLSTSFQTPLRPDIPALAGRARKVIKRNNVIVPVLQMPVGVIRCRNWRRDIF